MTDTKPGTSKAIHFHGSVGTGINEGTIENNAAVVEGDQVGTKHNYASQQSLVDAAAEIQKLLEQLEQTYSTDTTAGLEKMATEAINRIDGNSALTQRILSALKAGGTAALDSLLDHPAASFTISALADWQNNKRS